MNEEVPRPKDEMLSPPVPIQSGRAFREYVAGLRRDEERASLLAMRADNDVPPTTRNHIAL